MHGENVGLRDIPVPLGVTRVVAGMHQLYPSEVEAAVREHPHFVLPETGEVGSVTSPHDGWRRGATHITLDLHVVPDPGTQVVNLQRLVQRHY